MADAENAIQTDALVIGAGPVGLFQAFQLGLQGLSVELVDALPAPGGQCIELYPDKPIYDIPGLPVCTGRELADRLVQQLRPFAIGWHLGQLVTELQMREDGRFDVATSQGKRFIGRSVFIAAGVGAFQPRPLKADGLDTLAPGQVAYQLQDLAPAAGQSVLVVGGETAAVAAAVHLAEHALAHPCETPAGITLMHRRRSLDAEAPLLVRFEALCAQGALRFVVGQVLAVQAQTDGSGALAAVQWVDEQGQAQHLPTQRLLVCQGLSPKLGPVAHWGLAMERRQLAVEPALCQTSTPGIYAVGDVISYPGKKKLILCGFHEATMAAFAALARLKPDEPSLLQYTTTSPRLQQRLGVARPA